MQSDKFIAVIYALMAALFYAVNVPCSKILLEKVPPVFMASLLYLVAGIGVGIMYCFYYKEEKKEERLNRADLLYTVGFEIVATTAIALLVFKEAVSVILWLAIIFITLSSIILTLGDTGTFNFSLGSLFVICATYGLSIFTYIKAQSTLGAAKVSAYYALATFIGVFLSFILLGEAISVNYVIAFIIMILGTILVIFDTLLQSHCHEHEHIFTHTHSNEYI